MSVRERQETERDYLISFTACHAIGSLFLSLQRTVEARSPEYILMHEVHIPSLTIDLSPPSQKINKTGSSLFYILIFYIDLRSNSRELVFPYSNPKSKWVSYECIPEISFKTPLILISLPTHVIITDFKRILSPCCWDARLH